MLTSLHYSYITYHHMRNAGSFSSVGSFDENLHWSYNMTGVGYLTMFFIKFEALNFFIHYACH